MKELFTPIASNDPEAIIKAVTDSIQPSPNKVISASKMFAGLIKNYQPKLDALTQYNFPGIEYTLTVLDGADDDDLKEAVIGSDQDDGNPITNAGLQGTMKLVNKQYPISAAFYRDNFLNLPESQRQNAIVNFIARKVSKTVVKALWLGDTTNATYKAFDGYLKLIEASAKTVKKDYTALTTFRDALQAGFEDIPEDYDESDYYIACSKKFYHGARNEVSASGGDLALSFYLGNRKFTVEGSDFLVIPGFPDDDFVMFRKEDLAKIDGSFTYQVDRTLEARRKITLLIWDAWMHANLVNERAILRGRTQNLVQ